MEGQAGQQGNAGTQRGRAAMVALVEGRCRGLSRAPGGHKTFADCGGDVADVANILCGVAIDKDHFGYFTGGETPWF